MPRSRSATSPRRTASPSTATARITLCEIKTTNKSWRSIPRTYLRQVWWQQHVLGAERTLVVWEEHDGFVPVDDEPRSAWVDRDEAEIAHARRARHRADRRTAPPHDARPDTDRATNERMPRPVAPREPFRALALAD